MRNRYKGTIWEISREVKSYNKICELKGIAPTKENVKKLKKAGW